MPTPPLPLPTLLAVDAATCPVGAPGYAVGLLRNVRVGPDIVAYLEAIDASLAPFEGRFVIHGGQQWPLEGGFPGDLIVIAFPDRAAAGSWYESPAYRAILPLRQAHAEGDVFLIDGVGSAHRATDVLSARRCPP